MGCGASADSLYAVHPPEQLHRPIPKDYARSPPITPSRKEREGGSEHTSRAGSGHNSRGGSSCGSRGGSDYNSRASTPSTPLPFAFRRCSNVESAESDGPRPVLTQTEIDEMLSNIEVVVQDETANAEPVEQRQALLTLKSAAIESLVMACEIGDSQLLRKEITNAAARGVKGQLMKQAQRRVTELDIEATIEAAMRVEPRDMEAIQRSVDKAEAIRFHSETTETAVTWLKEHKSHLERESQVQAAIKELLQSTSEPPTLLHVEQAVRAAQFAKVTGDTMRQLLQLRRTLREAAMQAEQALDDFISNGTHPRQPEQVEEAFAAAVRDGVPESVILSSRSELSREALELAIGERNSAQLSATLLVADGLDMQQSELYIRAQQLLEQMNNRDKLLEEGRKLRLQAEVEKVEEEMRKKTQANEQRARRRAERSAQREKDKADELHKQQVAELEQQRQLEADRLKQQQQLEAEEVERKQRLEEIMRPRAAPKYPGMK